MDIVSFETAKRLKEAGFPQPEAETGQFWYNQFKALSFIGRKVVSETGGADAFHCMSVDSGRSDIIIPKVAEAFFAPTATDILRELPGHDIEFWQPNCMFYIEDVFGVQSFSDNPAEAAAKAWIELNNKI